jgi:gliding motility-associated lipoprotein GldH
MKNVIFLFISCLIISCGRNEYVFKESYTFGENGWGKDEVVQFQTNFKDNQSEYKVRIILAHDQTYMYSNLLFSLLILTPDSVERNTDFELKLMDDNRNFTGLPDGDRIVFEFDGLKRTSFSRPGAYQFRFKHYMPFSFVGGLRELSMEIHKIQE